MSHSAFNISDTGTVKFAVNATTTASLEKTNFLSLVPNAGKTFETPSANIQLDQVISGPENSMKKAVADYVNGVDVRTEVSNKGEYNKVSPSAGVIVRK